jgi:WD repeat-containing protein 55
MPDIPVGAQIFDLTFHPSQPTVYTGLLTGEVKAFCYDEQGNHEERFVVRPSKRSCRGLALNNDGSKLWIVGKGKGLQYVLYVFLPAQAQFS